MALVVLQSIKNSSVIKERPVHDIMDSSFCIHEKAIVKLSMKFC